MFENAIWIKPKDDLGDICPLFSKTFSCTEEISSATLHITATGVYTATLNGTPVGNFVLAPGWTSYKKRHQYQSYDITKLLLEENSLEVNVGKGWCRGRLGIFSRRNTYADSTSVIAQIDIIYKNGKKEIINTDTTWQVSKSNILFSEIYDGEKFDASFHDFSFEPAVCYERTKDALIPQEGPFVTEHEHFKPVAVITTPKGETVLDFGQNLSGYVCFTITAKKGEILSYTHAETLDSDGNFYTENLRSAQQKIEYICCDGEQSYKPFHTFMGFRYIRLDVCPESVKPEDFEAIAIYSDMKRTGSFTCSNEKINQLFSNALWGQKSNYVDIPTDCPQRDERLGWLGDAQLFAKTASYNFDVEDFFYKWLGDVMAEQTESGSIPDMVPDIINPVAANAGWGDAIIICPWQMYLTYGDKNFLARHLDSMTAWIEFIRRFGDNEFLWIGGTKYGDWLGLDAEEGSHEGKSRMDFVASAFYANSVNLYIKTLKVLGKDSTEYEVLYENIVKEFRKTYPFYETQTECVLAIVFGLTPDKEMTANQLAEMIKDAGFSFKTGFIGTGYILDALTMTGHTDLAYTLLLREEYPSWLFSVNMGATTIWEHWDSIRADGSFWASDMNSFNHYAYGCVAAWMYETIAGIKIDEEKPAFEHIILTPTPDPRLTFAEGKVETRYGTVRSKWYTDQDGTHYEFDIPSSATLVLDGKEHKLTAGKYKF